MAVNPTCARPSIPGFVWNDCATEDEAAPAPTARQRFRRRIDRILVMGTERATEQSFYRKYSNYGKYKPAPGSFGVLLRHASPARTSLSDGFDVRRAVLRAQS